MDDATSDAPIFEFNKDGYYMSYPAVFLLLGILITLFLLLFVSSSVSVSVAFIRRPKKKPAPPEESDRPVEDGLAALNQTSSPYIVTPKQKMLKNKQNQALAPERIETNPHDLAGIISYLAENPVEDIQLRPKNRMFLLVDQQKRASKSTHKTVSSDK